MSHDYWPFAVEWVEHVSGTLYDVGVGMPLRAAITAGDQIMMQGVGIFEAMEGDMGNPAYGMGRVSKPSLSFMEVIDRTYLDVLA